MIVVGMLLAPVIVVIILLLRSYNSNKARRRLLHVSMWAISLIYIICCFALHIEPFDFEITEAMDYIIYTAVLVVCSPCLWVVIYYYCSALFRKMRVHKNARLKNKKQYTYYRDDLDKVAPSIVMFTYKMDLDIRKCMAATILKLKLNGYIKEMNSDLHCTDKNEDMLADSEKAVLRFVRFHSFDASQYRKLVAQETMNNKYLKKHSGGVVLKLFKMIATIILPIVLILASIQYDKYSYETYDIYVLDDVRYLRIKDHDEVDKLMNNITNKDDFYHEYWEDQDYWSYNYNLIRTDRLQYHVVRMLVLSRFLDAFFVLFSIVMVFVSMFMLVEQIIYFNKNYKRTLKGNDLINKAYALKNYLKEYSLIKTRTEEELALWGYYLIYSVVLDINDNIEDEVIDKYIRTFGDSW